MNVAFPENWQAHLGNNEHLAKLPNLRELSVSNTAVTDAGLDELLKFLPTLSVSDD